MTNVGNDGGGGGSDSTSPRILRGIRKGATITYKGGGGRQGGILADAWWEEWRMLCCGDDGDGTGY